MNPMGKTGLLIILLVLLGPLLRPYIRSLNLEELICLLINFSIGVCLFYIDLGEEK